MPNVKYIIMPNAKCIAMPNAGQARAMFAQSNSRSG